MGYWQGVIRQAWRETLGEIRLDSPVRVTAAIGSPLVAGASTWLATQQFAWGAASTLGVLIFLAIVTLIAKLWSIPPRLDAETRAKIVPRPFGETPLFKLIYCAPEEFEGLRTAVAKIEYVKDVRGGQLKVWGYENRAAKFLIEAHDNVTQMKDHVHTIPLATVAVFDRNVPNRWGNDCETFAENEPKLVVIEMTEGPVRQQVRIQMIAMLTGGQCHLRVHSPEWNPYFWPDPLPS